MKAWYARVSGKHDATVVFAETAGKAKSVALSTDCCEYADFCDIEVRREPQLDKYYVDGKKEMDWSNPNDRIALVKECGIYCDTEYWEREHCVKCAANEYCDYYQDILESEENVE